MGSSAEAVRTAYIAHQGPEAWAESRRAIAAFWAGLEEAVRALDLDFGRVRLYQDGLPVCGHELEIVRDLAETGGPNYRILLDLMARGAALEGTEDPDLLIREYALLKAVPSDPAAGADGQRPDAAGSGTGSLLEDRDRFIARRIDASLRPGETGILFLGALHDVISRLPPTITVRTLDQVLTESGSGR